MGAINYDWLQQYGRIAVTSLEQPVWSMPLAALKDPVQARQMLAEFNKHLRADSLRSAAVYFTHSLRGLVLGIHYMTAVCDARLDISLDNIELQLEVKNDRVAASFLLRDATERPHVQQAAEGDEPRNRACAHSSWRNEVLTAYYGEQLRPMIEGVAAAGGAKPGQMWSQLAGILRWFTTAVQQMPIEQAEREAVIKGYEHVISMPPDVLGLKRNLLSFKPVEVANPYQPGQTLLMKPACCLHHVVYDGQDYCYTCPKLSKAERQERYEAILAANK
ncbi:ferric iron reductase [Paenibacillus sp. FSL W8-0426]|uniref:ferric iron reductase n=1 Tax=Paenibacillus sp. FSL W8-0426 TaxID=2921714 RepID=UPI0030D730E5